MLFIKNPLEPYAVSGTGVLKRFHHAVSTGILSQGGAQYCVYLNFLKFFETI
jgi:hypothetical protein